MASEKLWLRLMIFVLTMAGIYPFHDAGNVLYHCWPLGASEGDPTISCDGLGLDWAKEPPDNVEIRQKFNVTYQALTTERFYRNSTIFPGKSESMIRELCLNTTCPENFKEANIDNCCIWHANIHSCRPSVIEAHRICGPWTALTGELTTYIDPLVGQIDAILFAQDIQIDFLGLNFVIVHLRVGNIQIILGKPVTVFRQRVCGDGVCSAEIGETCTLCATDCCGGIDFPVGAVVGGILAIGVLISIIIGISILAWYYVRKRKLLFDESWIIDFDDIQLSSTLAHPSTFFGSTQSLRESESAFRNSEASIKTYVSRQMFILTGTYEGRLVAIKKLQKRNITLTTSIRREVMQIRNLDHPNLCKFLGATIKNPLNICIINEYCPKGSLNDVLQNDAIPLNWAFRFSFAHDIANGMAFLHSNRIYHGNLNSNNCVIDNRWVVKISDYGLPCIRKADDDVESIQYDSSHRMAKKNSIYAYIYRPPEFWGNRNNLPLPTVDVYSFSILLIEIGTGIDPFSDDVCVDVTFKPTITKDDLTSGDNPCPCPDGYMNLINLCSLFTPSSRPTFDQIKKILNRINPNKRSPVDQMMIMMEKYSKCLESLVTERTQELIAEQKKTAVLLYSMLPRAVADDLKHGKPAPAKLFQSSTIYFSDIVGFTTLASNSTAFEVVTLLNELYSTFDEVLDQFDVYKVETIGDAYMVVSGVPEENGDRHATEIASMSLALLDACRTFKIPHLPDKKLEIRVGIHSGPVCAGVVGLKMPRYCLFGDTVNTASRMESNGEAMKIQCSEATYFLLKKLGGFRLECRGKIAIKGKGEMMTWWLVGHEEEYRDSLTGMDFTKSNIVSIAPSPSSSGSVLEKVRSRRLVSFSDTQHTRSGESIARDIERTPTGTKVYKERMSISSSHRLESFSSLGVSMSGPNPETYAIVEDTSSHEVVEDLHSESLKQCTNRPKSCIAPSGERRMSLPESFASDKKKKRLSFDCDSTSSRWQSPLPDGASRSSSANPFHHQNKTFSGVIHLDSPSASITEEEHTVLLPGTVVIDSQQNITANLL